MPFRHKVQMVFQDPYASLNPRQKVLTILTDPIAAQGGDRGAAARAKARDKAAEMLTLVGLDPKALERYPHEFSGGQRQRIGIARALMVDPAILVADEPVSSLDVSVQKQVLDLFATVRQRLNLAMIFITHDLRVAAQICDTIIVMSQGKVVEAGQTTKVLGNPTQPYTKKLVNAVPGTAFFSKGAGGRSMPGAPEQR
jgi:peptide/nickel transport system ATP-binding protein